VYPRIPWELVADPLGSSEYTLGTTALDERKMMECWLDDIIRENEVLEVGLHLVHVKTCRQ
jgi:hypothetical protein